VRGREDGRGGGGRNSYPRKMRGAKWEGGWNGGRRKWRKKWKMLVTRGEWEGECEC